MKALDRKLLRDLRLMWSQALTIALSLIHISEPTRPY